MKEFIEESKKIIQRSSYNNKLVLFIGAGVSINSGLPSWNELITEIKKKINISNKNEDYLKIAQYYYNSRGEKEYYDFLREKLEVDAKPNKIHDLLLELNPSHIITTNYDDLIEKAASKKGMFFDVVSKDNDLPYTPSNKMIIKMHGDFKNRNIVFKEDDYLSYSNNFKLIENYIKSLFATKTIIFVGYSLSDVNVKLIFQWIKDILGNDLPRPYFIDTSDEDAPININEFEYYKNRGINIIYYKEIAKLINSEKEENKGKRICNTINYLLKRDDNILNIEYIYEYIESFKDINVLDTKVLINLLNSLDLLNMTDYEIEWDTIYIRSEKFYKIFQEVINTIKEAENKSKIEYEKLKGKIEDFLFKLGIKYIVYRTHTQKEKLLYTNESAYEFLNESVRKNLETFNFIGSQNYIENSIFQEETIDTQNIKVFFEKAYSLYYLKRYYESYLEFKSISDFCSQNKNYMQYVLSEFNRYYVGRYVIWDWKVNEEVRKKVKDEIDKINLEKIVYNLPLEVHQLKFLNDIISWSFIQNDLKDMVDIKKEIEKNERTVYMGGVRKQKIGIYKLQEKVRRLWEFTKFNLLVIDKYKEVNVIFYNYIDSLLRNYTIPKLIKTKEESFWGLDGENIKIEEITDFDLRVMLEYISLKELKSMFEKYDVEVLNIKEENVKKILEIFENCINYNKEKNINISTILLILSKTKLTNELFRQANNIIIKMLNKNSDIKYDNEVTRYINSYLFYQEKDFKNYDRETLEVILQKILQNICSMNIRDNEQHKHIVNNICASISIYDSKNEFCKDELLNELIYRTKVDKDVYIILIHLYKIVNSINKLKIKTLINEYLNVEKFDVKQALVYYEGVSNNIIEPTEKNEEMLITLTDDIINERKNSAVQTYPDYSKVLLNESINLVLMEKVKNKELFKKYVEEEKDFNFLFNLEDYNGQEIKLEWLTEFTDKLLVRISKNKKIKKQIKKQVKEIYLSGENIDREILKIFMKYFLD